MKIAIIGSGISGLTAAYYLHQQHDITLFEASDRLGGHTATIDVDYGGQRYAVDTGFIVYNDWTYPNFIRLLAELGVASQPTSMSFSVTCEDTGLEYAGSNLNTLFSQRRNLVRPYFWRLLRDIVRFNRETVAELEKGDIDASITLGEYLAVKGYSKGFARHYLVPMAAAIWSAEPGVIEQFPLQFFIRFFKNHGLLSVHNRPQWRVICGGSREYIEPLTQGFQDSIRLQTAIKQVRRTAEGVALLTAAGEWLQFDQVVVATHSDQALRMLAEPTADERQLLGAIPYQDNEVVLHTDASRLPHRQRAWSCWNYRLPEGESQQAVLTYNMNLLQGLEAPATFCVSLNQSERIDPDKIIERFSYAHPVFTLAGVEAQQQWSLINGVDRIWFCGAYCGNGFHEDGVVSALSVVEGLQRLNEFNSMQQEQRDGECNLSRSSVA